MTKNGVDTPLYPPAREPDDNDLMPFRHNPAALSRRLPDGLLVLIAGQDLPLALRGSGSELWRYLEEPHSYAELVEHLAMTYAVSPSLVHEEVSGVWRQLRNLDAVVPA